MDGSNDDSIHRGRKTIVANAGARYGRPRSNGFFQPDNWFTGTKAYSSKVYRPWEFKMRHSSLSYKGYYEYEMIQNPDGGGLVGPDEVDIPSSSFGQGRGGLH